MRTADLVSIRVIRGVFFNTNLSNLSNAMRLANLDSIREIRVKKTLRASLIAFDKFVRIVFKIILISRPPEYLPELLKSNFLPSENFNVFYNLGFEKFSRSPFRAPT